MCLSRCLRPCISQIGPATRPPFNPSRSPWEAHFPAGMGALFARHAALWPKEHIATQRISGYLTRKGLQVFLEGGVPEFSEEHLLPAEMVYGYDRRTGIGVDVDRYTAEEGLIYSAKFLSLRPGVGMYAEIVLPATAPSDVLSDQQGLPFGGEGRHVLVQQVEPFDWPAARPGKGRGTLVLLTTPGLFHSTRAGQNWKPACFDDRSRLVAAAVPGFLPVSGWNLATGGPKPNRFAVSAGSVYFLEGAAEDLPTTAWPTAPRIVFRAGAALPRSMERCLMSVRNGHVSGLLFLHAQTAIHPGSGTALGVVDLPVQRERHTQWPVIPGSSLKGVLRDCCRQQVPGKRGREADADPDLADRLRADRQRMPTSTPGR